MNAFEHNPIRILCNSLTPTTLAAVIADLDAHDQEVSEDQQVADAIRAGVAIQLECMVGADEAQSLVSCSRRRPTTKEPIMPCHIEIDDDYLYLKDDQDETLDAYRIHGNAKTPEQMIDEWAMRHPLDAEQAQAELAAYHQQDVLFALIAREALGIETLEARNMDSLDFHEVPVWSVKAALRQAHVAGRELRSTDQIAGV